MQVVRGISEFKCLRSRLREGQTKVSLVPTMGALHEGHLSLVRRAKQISDHVVVSIFVNPAQFAPGEDFEKYPRGLEQDLLVSEKNGVDSIFIPEISQMYPEGFRTFVLVEGLSQKLCGISRPNHFRGVTTVVLKLFNIIQPNLAVFGQKDAQQSIIIRRMVRDLDLDVEIVVCPIVREADGLALSSRNKYLKGAERETATVLFQCLEWAKQKVAEEELRAEPILSGITKRVENEPLARLDYAEIVDTNDLAPLTIVKENSLLALAVFIGDTRLIDNTLLRPIDFES
jgi:pantoate--beta-alanine ligase